MIFIFSVSSHPQIPVRHENQPVAVSFPTAGVRQVEQGGDLPVAQLPASQPTMPLRNKGSQDFNGDLTAVSALVVDDKTDTVLFSKNADEVRPLASITKLMSAMVLLELPIDWSTSTVVQAEDIDVDNHINVGEEFVLNDLWNIALIGSSNNSIKALVRSSGISEDNFVTLMNKKAQNLGLSSAHFVEPTGLDPGNVASAADAAKLLKEALKYNKILKTMQVGEYYAHPLNQDKSRRVWTTNLLLTNWVPNDFKVENIVGKTGYIDDSRYNFVVRLGDNYGHALRVVILGAGSNDLRFSEARDLAEWTLNDYLWPDQDGYSQLVE